MCVVLHFIWHLLKSTWNPIVCEFSNCASSCISFHIHCNRLAILSFLILKFCVFLHLYPHSVQSTCPLIIYVSSNCAFSCISFKIIAIDSSSNNLWIFKLCIVLHLFPHSLQLTCPPIICEFKIDQQKVSKVIHFLEGSDKTKIFSKTVTKTLFSRPTFSRPILRMFSNNLAHDQPHGWKSTLIECWYNFGRVEHLKRPMLTFCGENTHYPYLIRM